MKKINTFKTNHTLLFSLLLIVCEYILRVPSKELLQFLGLPNDGTIRWNLPCQILYFAISGALVFFCGQKYVFAPRKGFFRSLWSGAVFFVLAAIGCTVFISDGLANGKDFAPVWEIIAFVVFVLLIGFSEELLFRGIITDCLLERFGQKPWGIAGAVAFSGVIFGLAHITNIFAGQAVDETIVQMIAVSLTGILFSAIYAKHRNVYGVAVLHALLDLMGMSRVGFFGGDFISDLANDMEFWPMLKQSLTSQSLFLIITIFVLHPGVLKRLSYQNSKINTKENCKTENDNSSEL